jgi:hypothetical protein
MQGVITRVEVDKLMREANGNPHQQHDSAAKSYKPII